MTAKGGLKVLHLTTVHARHDQRILAKECAALRQAGHEVMLLVADGLGAEAWNGIQIHDVGARGQRLHRMTVLPWRALRRVRRLNPDVVHIHDPELLPVAVVLSMSGKLVVYDAHEDLPRSIKSKHWLPNWLLGTVSFIAERVENFCAGRMSAVVAATSPIAARFERPNRLVATIRNYPNLSNVPIVEPSPEPKTFCYVGAISLHRGIMEMLRATHLAGARLILAGRFGDEQLQATVEKLPEWNNVEYLGVVPHEEVWPIMRRAHAGLLFLHPVRNYIDSLPVKLFEYMAAGLPVLASDYAGWPDIVRSNQTGYLADPLDAEAIARVMRRVLAEPKQAQKMGQLGRKLVLSGYSWANEANNLVKLYEQLAAGPRQKKTEL
ncbi:MAG: glycosyltransferase family 4 protein [Rhizobiaceae bacterium]|nr:glycosyltransferase family 4 protein [Rhizobiaceae bacterium]